MNPKTVNGDRIKFHGKMTLTIAIPLFQHNKNSTFYIADVIDNIIGLDFLEDKVININCRNLTVTDNVTEFTQQFTCTTKSQPCSSRFSGPVSDNPHSSQKHDGTTLINFRKRRYPHAMYSQHHASHHRFDSTYFLYA